MPELTTHAPGAFCWMELGTTDPEAAQKFYGHVFGWDFQTNDLPDDMGTYTMILSAGKSLGGMYSLSPALREQGVPPHWLSYINVEDLDQATNAAEAAGAEVKQPPMDVMEMGRMSVLQDPTGAVIALWQAKTHIGRNVSGEFNTACWFELMTRDPEAAKKFYGGVFRYEIDEQDMGGSPYTMLAHGETRHGGIMQITPEMGPVPPHWMIYIAVEDAEDTFARAQDSGSKVLVPLMELPVGRFFTFMDPQGAPISAIQLST